MCIKSGDSVAIDYKNFRPGIDYSDRDYPLPPKHYCSECGGIGAITICKCNVPLCMKCLDSSERCTKKTHRLPITISVNNSLPKAVPCNNMTNVNVVYDANTNYIIKINNNE
jgi:hypothetical protein